ncbi:MAG: type-F conjugative transfer system pilin assembly protein TrbC [Pseudomonadota bacterium]|nr:type-F conjugative transfer system pilin assembly protein TrbC [Pseudomonadota bacterium]MDP2352683.1 type-F conjugative transfer system pilin assembly protein TrbC [Pseudomonadota bacterium]
MFRYAAVALGCLIASHAASHAGAAQALPSDDAIKARMRALSGGVPEALDRAGREAPKPGEVKIDVPPALPGNRMVDLEALARQFNGGRPAVQKTGSDLMVFVSLSMPEHVIQSLARQAKEAGAVMVLRGLKGGSWPETWKALAALNQGIGAEWIIHPEGFKQFKVAKVPTIVLADGRTASVLEDGCAEAASYAALAGDVSIEQALGIMKLRGEPVISQLAVGRLGRLRRAP